MIKNYIWGSEIWSLSAHHEGDCRIINSDITLSHLYNIYNKNFYNEKFPVMIKIIDAKLPLSVQVHPDNDYAAKFEHDSGKTEMWHIISHEPDAFLYLGFNDNYSRADVECAIKNGTLINMLKKIKVHDGDKFFIPAGTVHAIGGGILLAETQQNSNLTYRVFDYNRLGADDKPRELHIKKALDVMKLKPADYSVPDDAPFQSQFINIKAGDEININANGGFKFLSVILISGAGVLADINHEAEIELERYKAVLAPLGGDFIDFIFKADSDSAVLVTIL